MASLYSERKVPLPPGRHSRAQSARLCKQISGWILNPTISLGQVPFSVNKLHKGMWQPGCYYSPYFADGECEAQ